MAGIAIRTDFPDEYLASMLPALKALSKRELKAFPEQYSEYFQVKESTQSIEQMTSVGQFGLFVPRQETQNTVYENLAPSFPKTFTHLSYTLGYELSHELVADDKFGLAAANASALGRSGRITPEIFAASIFNNGFDSNFNGPDGVPLFSTAHPNEGENTTQANRPSVGVDLNIPALEAGLTTMRQLTDNQGKLWLLPPEKLIVPPQLEFRAAEFLGGVMRSDTAKHTVNAFRQRSDMAAFTKWRVWDYLSNPRAWFLQASVSATGLIFWWRERYNEISKLEFENRSVKNAAWMRFVVGFAWWQGVYGSPGGGS